MNRKSLIKISTSIVVLIFFAVRALPLPLTKTLYIVPSDKLDVSVSGDYIFADKQFTRESFTAGTGLWNGVSLTGRFDALGDGVAGFDSSGDAFLDFIMYIDTLSQNRIRTAYYCSIRFPTGPDAYSSDEFRNVALGKSELKTGPVLAFEYSENLTFFANLFYVFRQGASEGFYGGFKVNPGDSDSYKSCFGLNPLNSGAFLYYKKLKNDYIPLSVAGVYSGLSPFILFAEVYYSRKVCNNSDSLEGIPIEGDRINPLFISSGLKFFLSDSFFIQGYGLINPFMNKDFIKWQMGFLFSLIF